MVLCYICIISSLNLIWGDEMALLGSEKRPVIVKVRSAERAEQIARVCTHLGLHFIIGLEMVEDMSGLEKAIKQKLREDDPYADKSINFVA